MTDVSKTRSGTVRISEATLRQAEDEALEKAMKIKKQARRAVVKFAPGQPRRWQRRSVRIATFTLKKWVPVGPRQLEKSSTNGIDGNGVSQQTGAERPLTAPITRSVTAALGKETREMSYASLVDENNTTPNETNDSLAIDDIGSGGEGQRSRDTTNIDGESRKRPLDALNDVKSDKEMPPAKETRTETNKPL
jgi:hypothetical protein